MFVRQLCGTLGRFDPPYREFRQSRTPTRTLFGASMEDTGRVVKTPDETDKILIISKLNEIRRTQG